MSLPFKFVVLNNALKQQLVVKEVVLDKVVEELVEDVIAEAVFDVVEVVRESRIVVLAEVVVSAFELVTAVVVDSPEKQYTFDRAIDPWESQIIRKIRTLVNCEVTSITCKSPIFTPPRTLESWAVGWFKERTITAQNMAQLPQAGLVVHVSLHCDVTETLSASSGVSGRMSPSHKCSPTLPPDSSTTAYESAQIHSHPGISSNFQLQPYLDVQWYLTDSGTSA
ncbi:hypothetical protein BT96DRAFT_993346 [Gymnopus androsaceus JB14]|uniref:Uncharacterized protein n=1 Tax=Gymnopus androsaceus JB14 TaxID=1447944 RepID=A0A6A4HSQ3_9AGAR|nr:hypothetical protein BT96DRAFT_993346 [Gymnopus androsaceus JB14]